MGQIKIPRITTAQRTGITPDVGELIYDTTNGGVYKGDGATAGGVALGGGSGTVTSVAASVPTFLSVSGSPITTSGTLAVTLSGTALPVLNGGTGVTTSTGSGNTVLSISPTLVTPILGSASATALTFTSTAVSGLTINKLTTAQRQALTPVIGDVVYDTTIGTTCTYNGTFWEYTLFKNLTANFSTTSITMVTVTGFTFPVEANSTYLVEGVWLVGTSSTSGYTIGGNTVFMARFITTNVLRFSGFLTTVGTSGNINMKIASALASNTLTVNGGISTGLSSYATFKKIA